MKRGSPTINKQILALLACLAAGARAWAAEPSAAAAAPGEPFDCPGFKAQIQDQLGRYILGQTATDAPNGALKKCAYSEKINKYATNNPWPHSSCYYLALDLDKHVRAARDSVGEACALLEKGKGTAAGCDKGQAACFAGVKSLFKEAGAKVRIAATNLTDAGPLAKQYQEKLTAEADGHVNILNWSADAVACAKQPKNVNCGIHSLDEKLISLNLTIRQFLQLEGETVLDPGTIRASADKLKAGENLNKKAAKGNRDSYVAAPAEIIYSLKDTVDFSEITEKKVPDLTKAATEIENMSVASAVPDMRSIPDSPAVSRATPPLTSNPVPATAAVPLDGASPAANPAVGLSSDGSSPSSGTSLASGAPAAGAGSATGASRAISVARSSGAPPSAPVLAPAAPSSASPSAGGAAAAVPTAVPAQEPPRAMSPVAAPYVSKAGETAVAGIEPAAGAATIGTAAGPSGTLPSMDRGRELSAPADAVRAPAAAGSETYSSATSRAVSRSDLKERLRRSLSTRDSSAASETPTEGAVRAALLGTTAFTGEGPASAPPPFTMDGSGTSQELERLEDEKSGLLGSESVPLFRRVHDAHRRIQKLWQRPLRQAAN